MHVCRAWIVTSGCPEKALLLDESLVLCHAQSFNRAGLFCDPWTVAHLAPLSMGFSRQEYWSGLPFPPPGDLLNTGIKPVSLISPASAGRFFTTEPPGKSLLYVIWRQILSWGDLQGFQNSMYLGDNNITSFSPPTHTLTSAWGDPTSGKLLLLWDQPDPQPA